MGRGFTGPQGVGMGQENFSRHAGWGGNGARQNLAGQGRKPHPSDPSRLAPLPSLYTHTQGWALV